MPMEPPPSRYRVVERGGRLVVFDSVVGGAPRSARELLPEVVDDTIEPYPRDPQGGVSQRGDPESQSMSLETLDPRFRGDTGNNLQPSRPAAAQAMIAEPPGLLRNVASTVCGDRRDADGRLRWTTARWFDSKGPRTLTLTENSEKQLGFGVLMLVIAAFVAVFLLVMGDVVGWVIVGAGVIALNQVKPGVTAWIDRISRV